MVVEHAGHASLDVCQVGMDRARRSRTCLTLLAVLCGDRDEEILMVPSLDSTSATTVDGWLNELAKDDPVLSEFLTGALRQAELCDLGELRQWLERTRRYSFYR